MLADRAPSHLFPYIGSIRFLHLYTFVSKPGYIYDFSGLAVMGQNLILNMNDHGFVVVAYNRTTAKVDQFLQNEVIHFI